MIQRFSTRGPAPLDLTGQRFGRLLVTGLHERRLERKTYAWKCVCDCGERTIVCTTELRAGTSTSCGCLRSEQVAARNFRHGKRDTPEYKIWLSMKDRCLNHDAKNYGDYGGRGITVCPRWLDSFEAFLEDMGERPGKKHTVERIDNDEGYSPENCKWTPWSLQNRNTRRNVYLTYEGETRMISEWAKEFSVSITTIKRRLAKGWTDSQAIGTPFRRANPLRNIRRTESTIRLHMIARCYDMECSGYSNYGGRGIQVCQRWRDSLTAFREDMGPRPSLKHSINRIDNDGNYEPGNCRWALPYEQAMNTRRNKKPKQQQPRKQHPHFRDLAGQIFGRWSVIRSDGHSGHNITWLCRCSCGTEKKVCGASLTSGKSRSCGCRRRQSHSP